MATPIVVTILNIMIQNNAPFQRHNGSDHLSVFLVVAAVVLVIIGSVVDNETAKYILDAIALAFAIYSGFRMLSTNIAKRREENDRFLAIFGKKADYSNSSSYWGGSNNGYTEYRNATPSWAEERQRAREEKLRAKEEARKKKAERKESEKIYAYYNCPKCRAELRVPRGKGKIKIRCPKCGEEFIKRT